MSYPAKCPIGPGLLLEDGVNDFVDICDIYLAVIIHITLHVIRGGIVSDIANNSRVFSCEYLLMALCFASC